ncbi:acyl-CoA carboxylase subunit epsilon [Mobilicoccus massiliensis]|uniref:acyl-CoA carboxylase subunit epsilon n=1 Tax=Mobilicoccus massiliensis TaxID=1522310 RepID=UPI00058F82AB|nr:acyl-CoA carboxylase subunit epsilon [Mobilicoccus massiliensis]
MSDETTETTPPTIRVTRGNPSPEEVAVVTVLLSAMSGGESGGGGAARRGWSSPARRLNTGLSPMGWGRF